MSRETNKILNYTVMAAAFIGLILSLINKEWTAGMWAFNCLIWVVICHINEINYYDSEESLDKLTDEYYNALIKHEKEVKELKDEIKKLSKGE